MIGQTLGHYRILEKIGAGGMGVVYRARDERLNRDVALKVLPPGTLADEAARKRFRKEALALSRLNHPHIATIYDFDTQEGVDFLVMEYLPGGNLAHRLSGGPLSEKEIAVLGGQIAAALEEAHEKGIVHRDLKPGNIAMDPRGQAKVLDFGLARVLRPGDDLGATASLTGAHFVAGTYFYMSPEQLRGEPADARTDIYALGVVLYEMTTGQLPFREDSGPRLTDAILHRPPVAPRAFNARISPELERVILKCLEKDPENRFQSAKEVGVDLRRLVTDSWQTATLPVAGRTSRRGLVAWIAAGVAAVALALVASNVGGMRDRIFGGTRGRIESVAVLPLENLSGDPGQEYMADGMTEALITDLAQISALRVISRTSVMQYKRTSKPLPAIAKELHVDGVVEGSLQRSGNRVRVTVQLIQASTDRHLWAQTFERDFDDVLTLQSEFARAIADEVRVQLTPREQARLARARSVNPEAYQLYLQGRFYWNKRNKEAGKKALEYFQRAVERDPTYAPAHAGLADSLSMLGEYGVFQLQEAKAKAKIEALKAVELDDGLGEAHASLAQILRTRGEDSKAAEKEFRRALELNPNYATAHHWYSGYLLDAGRLEESVEEIQRALELDPLSLIIRMNVVDRYYYLHQFDRAIEECERIFEMDPNFAQAHGLLVAVYQLKGMFPEAINEQEKYWLLFGDKPEEVKRRTAMLRQALAAAGPKGYWRRQVEIAKADASLQPFPEVLAGLYAHLDERDQAFACLEKALQDGSLRIGDLKYDPHLDPLRSDPRYQDLVRRLERPR